MLNKLSKVPIKLALVLLIVALSATSCMQKQGISTNNVRSQKASMLVAKQTTFSNVPIFVGKQNSRIWVPVEKAANSLNYDLHWTDGHLSMGHTDPLYSFTLNSKKAISGDKNIVLPQAPTLMNNKPYITLQSLATLLGTNVHWDASKAQIQIEPQRNQANTSTKNGKMNTLTSSQTAIIVSSVSFRTGPSTSYRRIRYLQKGETVTILSQVNKYWYQIKDKNNRTGYVSTSSRFIQLRSTSPTISTKTGVIVSSVSFRTGPSTSYRRIRYLQKGETVTILSQVNKYWYKIKDKNNRTGYVSTSSRFINVSTTGTTPAVPTTPTPTPTPTPTTPAPTPTASVKMTQLISYAKTFLGTPYKFGSGPYDQTHTFDCSSFVQYVYKHYGISLPRSSRSQSNTGTTVARSNLQPGDLIFFYTPGRFSSNKIVGHVGMYIGNNKMINTYGAPGVTITDISTPSWSKRYLFAKREA